MLHLQNLTTFPVVQLAIETHGTTLCTLQLIVVIMLTTFRTRFIHHIILAYTHGALIAVSSQRKYETTYNVFCG